MRSIDNRLRQSDVKHHTLKYLVYSNAIDQFIFRMQCLDHYSDIYDKKKRRNSIVYWKPTKSKIHK